MSNKNSLILALLIGIIVFIFYSWNIVPSYVFGNDAARDLVEIHEILEGDFRLVGPNASFGGLKTGPYYYYLFAPILFFTKGSVEAFLYFNAFIFSLALVFFFWTLLNKNKLIYGILGTITVAVSPLFIYASRNPGNANTYLPFLLIVLTLLSFYPLTGKNLVLIGFLMGIIVNFQYANVLVFIALSGYLFYKFENKKDIFYYLIPYFITFAPLVLFELRHDFVMTKNTLFSGSYKGFIENTQLDQKDRSTRNIGENIFFISDNIKQVIGINPLLVFFGIGVYFWKFTKSKSGLSFIIFIASVLILSIISLQFQFARHYIFPASLCILFMSVFFAIKKKLWYVLVVLIFFELQIIPLVFNKSELPYTFHKDIVQKVIAKNIIKNPESFNIIQIRPETATTPHGFEYRYFFILNGIKPLDIQNYNASKQLLIFSRSNDFNLSKLDTWEMQQFGNEHKKKAEKVTINGVDVYSLIK